MKEQLDHLVHEKEKQLYTIALVISILIYIGLVVSLFGIILMLIGFIFMFFMHGLTVGQIRNNAVKISENQFPLIHQKTQELCEKMGITNVPDIYLIESGGLLNAFATRFFKRNIIVLYSEIVELVETNNQDELSYIIAHELAHIKRNHFKKQLILMPAMPLLGKAYYRSCEYTCDRFAAHFTNNLQTAQKALTILVAGKVLFNNVNQEEYLSLNDQEKGFFVWLSEVISTHPPIPKRMNEINKFFNQSTNLSFHRFNKKILLNVSAAGLLLGMLAAGSIWGVNRMTYTDRWAEYQLNEGATALMLAVSNDNTDKVEKLLEAGADPNAKDMDEWTALHWVNQGTEETADIVGILLEYGANPNVLDNAQVTPLTNAIYSDDTKVIKLLLDAGADPNIQDDTGWTPLMASAFYGYKDNTVLLLEAGAKINIKDNEGKTALDYAQEQGYEEIVDLLTSN